jgi:hypothetical protein
MEILAYVYMKSVPVKRTKTTMENRKSISSGGEANNMKRSKLRRESAVHNMIRIKSLIVDLLRDSSRPLDHFKWKYRISEEKWLRIRSPECPSAVIS